MKRRESERRVRGLQPRWVSASISKEAKIMSAPGTYAPLDEAKLNEFMGKAVGDMGAALHAVTILLGDRLGLYKAMGDSRPVLPSELAQRTGTHERYVTEWLN